MGGVKMYNINFMDNKFPDNLFDIVHCSHVIEHIAYPKIMTFLDELIRITKPGGHIIIRSPLMSPGFLLNIDHIRPYPPKAILDYYSNPQQQVVGEYSITPVKIHLRRGPYQINPYSYNVFFRTINLFFKLSWSSLRIPFSGLSSYIAIFRKE
jgi:ubiquinone/menaquinone biosynthesis C-methylase UbiE